MTKSYRGRFAPTPSGGLHLGSLLVALASYLDAKSVNGQWLLRIEDVDPYREVAGASNNILHTLESFGFEWDGEVVYQSSRFDAYQTIVSRFFNMGLAYGCDCSRKQLEPYAIYPNSCRDALKSVDNAAIRIRVPELTYQFIDRIQGPFSQHLGRDVGDFIIKRRDNVYAYQLAVVLDDAEQGITDIVRGADLLDSTPRQLYLQELLGFVSPQYLHVPVLVKMDGHKLSKSNCAPVLQPKEASKLLIMALDLLGQKGAVQLQGELPTTILQWAIANWQIKNIPQQSSIVIDESKGLFSTLLFAH